MTEEQLAWKAKLESNEVLEFIYRRFQGDSDWLTGNCFYFALILCERFKYLNIYYAPIAGHFVAGHNDKYYDWCGEYEDEIPILLTEIEQSDPLWYSRIVRDCIL